MQQTSNPANRMLMVETGVVLAILLAAYLLMHAT
jgi:hypothetical protein